MTAVEFTQKKLVLLKIRQKAFKYVKTSKVKPVKVREKP